MQSGDNRIDMLSEESKRRAKALADQLYEVLGDYKLANEYLLQAETFKGGLAVTYPLNYFLLQQRLPSEQRQIDFDHLNSGSQTIIMPAPSAIRNFDLRCLGFDEYLPDKQEGEDQTNNVKEFLSSQPLPVQVYFYGVCWELKSLFEIEQQAVLTPLQEELTRVSGLKSAEERANHRTSEELIAEINQIRQSFDDGFKYAMSHLTVNEVREAFNKAETSNPDFVGYINALTALESIEVRVPFNAGIKAAALKDIKARAERLDEVLPDLREKEYLVLRDECAERYQEIEVAEAYHQYKAALSALTLMETSTPELDRLRKDSIDAIGEEYDAFMSSDVPLDELSVYRSLDARCKKSFRDIAFQEMLLALGRLYELTKNPPENNAEIIGLRDVLLTAMASLDIRPGMSADDLIPKITEVVRPFLFEQYADLLKFHDLIPVLLNLPWETFLPDDIQKRNSDQESHEQQAEREREAAMSQGAYVNLQTFMSAMVDLRSEYIWHQCMDGKLLRPGDMTDEEARSAFLHAIRYMSDKGVNIDAAKYIDDHWLDIGTRDERKNTFINQTILLGQAAASLRKGKEEADERPVAASLRKDKEEADERPAVADKAKIYIDLAATHNKIREALPLNVLQAQINKITTALEHGNYEAVVKELFELDHLLLRVKRWMQPEHIANQKASLDFDIHAAISFLKTHYIELSCKIDEDIFRHGLILRDVIHRVQQQLVNGREGVAGDDALTLTEYDNRIETASMASLMHTIFMDVALETSPLFPGDVDYDESLDTDAHIDSMHDMLGRMQGQVDELKQACETYLEHLQEEIIKLYPDVFKKLPDDIRVAAISPELLLNTADGKKKLDLRDVKSVMAAMEAAGHGEISDERYTLAVDKFAAVSEMHQKLSQGPTPTRLLEFRKSFNHHRKLIETRRDHPAMTFLKVVATILTRLLSPLLAHALGIWRVRGKEVAKDMDIILGDKQQKPR